MPVSDDATALIEAAVRRALTDAHGPIYVGVSGGLDSTVLLHAVARVAKAAHVTAVHVHHALHADADRWQRHCERLAGALGTAVLSRRVTVMPTGSVEAAARVARYEAFAACLSAPDVRLLLAHHRNDQTETLLLRLLQGRGLYGMPRERPLAAGRLLRPFLDLPRSVLERYARAHRLEWLEDPANADLRLDRNFVRHVVLPGLRERFPGVDDALHAAVADAVAQEALLVASRGSPVRRPVLPLEALAALEPVQQLVLLRLWLQARHVPLPPRRAMAAFLRQLSAAADRQPRLAVAGGELRRYREGLWFVEPPPELLPGYPLATTGRLRLPHGELRIVADRQGFAPQGRLVVRFRSGGERILAGGCQRRLKHLMHDAGLPPWVRDTYPLVTDAAGIASVPGIATRDAEPAGRPRYRAEWRPLVRRVRR
jgi:tRNA(Ile)-lysidine synthase